MKKYAVVTLAILMTLPAQAGTMTDELPQFRGDTWSIVDPDDGLVGMLVFHNNMNVTVYTYDKAAGGVLEQLSSTTYETTPTGYRAQDSSGEWHTWDILDADHLKIDGDATVPMTQTTQSNRMITQPACLGACGVTVCNPLNYHCCGCCFCVHACMGISFADGLCCFYTGGC